MASVTDKATGTKKFITSDSFGGCMNRNDFLIDLRRIGHTVHRCEIAEVFEFVLDNGFEPDSEIVFKAARNAYESDDLTLAGFELAMGEILMA